MAAGSSSLVSLARAASVATVGALNSTGLLEQSQARFYSFTTWGGSSYTVNADVYLSVSALINAFLLLGLVSWVLNSARQMALSDKAVFDREDQHQQAATDVIERHRYLLERPDVYEPAESDAGYSWLTTTDRPRFEPDFPYAGAPSSEPGSIDDILGYMSKSSGGDPEDDASADDYHGPYAGYSNYAQYLATVYGYRTGDSADDSYSQRSGDDLGQVLPHPYRTAKEYQSNNSRDRGRQPESAALRDLRPSYGSRRAEKQDRTGGRQRVSLQEDSRDGVNHRTSGSTPSRRKPAHPNY